MKAKVAKTTITPEQAKQLAASTVVLEMRYRHPVPQRRQTVTEDMALGMDEDWSHLGKDIWKSRWFTKIVLVAHRVRTWLQAGPALKESMLPMGCFQIPVVLLDIVYARLEEFRAEHTEYLDTFIASYDELKAEAKNRLNVRYSDSDYPPAESLRAAFSMDWRLVEYGTPGAEKIGTEKATAEQAKAAERMLDNVESVIVGMRQSVRDCLAFLNERLNPESKGAAATGKKVLTSVGFKRCAEYLALVKQINVLDDKELAKAAEKTAALLDGREVDSLRDDTAFRSEVRAATTAGMAALDQLLAEAPARMISFGD